MPKETRNVRSSFLLLLLFISLSLSVACGGMGIPSEDDARAVFTHDYPPLAMGIARLKSFHKTNGQAQEMFGVKAYQLDYSAEVEWIALTPQAAAALRANPSWTNPPGYVAKESGSYNFQKTEKGWLCDKDGKIY